MPVGAAIVTMSASDVVRRVLEWMEADVGEVVFETNPALVSCTLPSASPSGAARGAVRSSSSGGDDVHLPGSTPRDWSTQAVGADQARMQFNVTGAGVLIITHDLGVVAEFADRAVVVVNPEVSSVRDSDRVLGIMSSKSRRAEQGQSPIKEHLLLTRYSPDRVEKGDMMSIADVEEILGVKVIGAPVIRERDGLAMSSRNVYLSPDERRTAPVLFRTLKAVSKRMRDGDDFKTALAEGGNAIREAGFALDYLEARHAENLSPITSFSEGPVRLLVAAKIGTTRLIDNIKA